ncbi:MAG: hypothetical protein AAB922_08005 [Patescibacteria group bacterium]
MKNITLEQLAEEYQKGKAVIEETEASLSVIKDEILDHLKKLKVDGLKTKNGYYVKRVRAMVYTRVSLSTAKELGATKTKEIIDIDLLRKMQTAGQKIVGAKQIVYVKVTAAE